MNNELCKICQEPETDPDGLCERCDGCSLCCPCDTFDEEQAQREDDWAAGKNVN